MAMRLYNKGRYFMRRRLDRGAHGGARRTRRSVARTEQRGACGGARRSALESVMSTCHVISPIFSLELIYHESSAPSAVRAFLMHKMTSAPCARTLLLRAAAGCARIISPGRK